MPDCWMDKQLKPNMVEGKDYLALHCELGIYLIKAYQVEIHGPIIRLGIYSSEDKDAEGCYEAYMKRIEFTAFPSDGFLRLKHPMQILISRAAPVQNMMKKILRVLGNPRKACLLRVPPPFQQIRSSG